MHPPKFVGNVGKNKEIFQSNHNFFRLINDDKEALRNRELMKLNAPKYKMKTEKGKTFEVNIFGDKSDIVKNIEAAKISLDVLNHQLNIRPHLNGFKNPEFIDLKERLGDRVSPKWIKVKTATNNAFAGKLSKKRNGQLSDLENTFIVLEVNFKKTDGNIEAFIRQSWSKFNQYKTLDYVIYYFDNKAIKVERESLVKGGEEYKTTIESFLKGK